MIYIKRLALLSLMLAASACAFLPRNGPDEQAIVAKSKEHLETEDATLGYDYVVVDVTKGVLPFISQDDTSSFNTFGANGSQVPSIRLGAGDVIQLTIFESQAGGLFIPAEAGSRPGNFVQLPPQEIGRDGMISVPYAGNIRAAGNTPTGVERVVENKLKDRAINPQVTLEVVQANYPRASVIGEVNEPGVFTLRNSGDRVLDIIAQAGGISGDDFATFVTLARGGRSVKIAYNALTASPQENIFVAPGDSINVSSESKKFYAFGATGSVGEFSFGSETLDLNGAVAQAVGLNDDQADPAQVFIYRTEEAAALRKMGVELAEETAREVPTIYRANFRKPDSFFMAKNFQVRDGDIVYVSNADSVSISKFFGLATTVSGNTVQLDGDITSLKN